MNRSADEVVDAINNSDRILIFCVVVPMAVLMFIPSSFVRRFDSSLFYLLWNLAVLAVFFLVWQLRRLKIARLLDIALASEGSPSNGTSLRLIELLYSRFFTNDAKGQVIELVSRGDMAELVLHQETMQRFAGRWLKWTWGKESPLNRFAADLAYHDGWLPVEMQEKMKEKLYNIDTAFER